MISETILTELTQAAKNSKTKQNTRREENEKNKERRYSATCKMATMTLIFAEVESKAERAEIFKQDHKASKWQSWDSNALTVCLLKPTLLLPRVVQ